MTHFKELFLKDINEAVEDSVPASEYASGDNNNATFDDLIELISTAEEDSYPEVADIILGYSGVDIDTSDVQFGDLTELIKDLAHTDYNDVADDLLDYLDEFDGIVGESGVMDEAFRKRLASFNKSRKKFKKTGAKLKVDKLKNKTANRKKRISGRVKRKQKRFATKKYNAFRSKAIKSGKHVVKRHRGLK